ncbi:MAG TPA: hypothetical protein VD969_17955 [Symbiobacteriaceae bacterium]|nr:hypothetical protein [Symbiobacteriaceae bacterium]
MHVKQATSLRVDQRLYERMARLARERGTSITRQLEMAIQQHLESAIMEDHLPVAKPALERVISETLEATVTAKIEEVKQRLAGLLAKNAMDTAALYLLETRRMGDEEKGVLKKLAADHVRGRLAELHADVVTSDQPTKLKKRVEQLETELRESERQRRIEAARSEDRIKDAVDEIQREKGVVKWYKGLLQHLEAEWENTGGLLRRRKPFQTCVTDFQRQTDGLER